MPPATLTTELLHQAAFRTGLGNSLYCPAHMVGNWCRAGKKSYSHSINECIGELDTWELTIPICWRQRSSFILFCRNMIQKPLKSKIFIRLESTGRPPWRILLRNTLQQVGQRLLVWVSLMLLLPRYSFNITNAMARQEWIVFSLGIINLRMSLDELSREQYSIWQWLFSA